MKKLLFLLLVVCGTGSFIAAMDGVDIDTETDRHEDNSNASTSEPQEPENEEMLDDQSGNNSSRQTSSPRVRFVGDDDSDESMVNQNVATGGEGDTFANTQIVSNGVASEDAAGSVDRGLENLKQSRLNSLNEDSFFTSLDDVQKEAVERQINRTTRVDNVSDQQLFGEKPLEFGVDRNDLLKKYIRRDALARVKEEREQLNRENENNVRFTLPEGYVDRQFAERAVILNSELTPEQIEQRKKNIDFSKEGAREVDESIQNMNIAELRNTPSQDLVLSRNQAQQGYDAVNNRFKELEQLKEDNSEIKPTGDANRESASQELVKIKEEEKQLFNKRNEFALRLEEIDQVLEERTLAYVKGERDGLEGNNEKINVIDRLLKEKMEEKNKSIKENQDELDNLQDDINFFRGLRKGTRTRQEYDNLLARVNEVYGRVTNEIEELSVYEDSLGTRIKTKGWFGRTRTKIEYSPEEKATLDQIQNQKKQLEQLKKQAIREYNLVKETNPNEFRFIKKWRMERKWGSLSDGNPPVKYSLDDWNRLSNSYKRKMLKKDVQQYVDKNQDGVNRVNSQDAPKRNWFGRGPKDPDSSFREMAQLRYNAPERYSEGHWLRLNSREKRNMPNKELLKFADEIGPYGGRYGEQKGITLEQDKRIKILDKAQEQMRAEDQRRGSPIFRRNQGQDTSIAAAA